MTMAQKIRNSSFSGRKSAAYTVADEYDVKKPISEKVNDTAKSVGSGAVATAGILAAAAVAAPVALAESTHKKKESAIDLLVSEALFATNDALHISNYSPAAKTAENNIQNSRHKKSARRLPFIDSGNSNDGPEFGG